MKPINSTNHPDASENHQEIKLPSLSKDDLDKLDRLFSFMKKNKTEFINIHSFCKEKWGDNKLLYLFFAEYLRKNDLALTKNRKDGEKYVWNQIIAPRGLTFQGFKKEYSRQLENKRKVAQGKRWQQVKAVAGTALFNLVWFRFRSVR
jgi:hypothetical protein